MSLDQIVEQAIHLTLEDRAKLAALMLESLDSASEDEVAALWDQVAAERDAAMDADPSLILDARKEMQLLIQRYGG